MTTWLQVRNGDYSPAEDEVLFADAEDRGTVRGVMNLHGMNGTANQYLSLYRWYGEMLALGGFPTLAADFGGAATWGNDASLAAVSAAFAWWTGGSSPTKVKTDKVILLGGSMGCTTAGLWAIANPSKVAAIIMVLPAVDLQDLHDNRQISSPGDIAASIETAYTDHAGYLAALPSKNLNLTAQRAALAATGIPIQIHYSTNDPVAIPSIATAYAAAVGASIYSVGATGHSGRTLDQDVLRNFVLAHS